MCHHKLLTKLGIPILKRLIRSVNNLLALNLMNDIVHGKYTAEKARKIYAEVTAAFMMNRPAPYAEALQFTPPTEVQDLPMNQK